MHLIIMRNQFALNYFIGILKGLLIVSLIFFVIHYKSIFREKNNNSTARTILLRSGWSLCCLEIDLKLVCSCVVHRFNCLSCNALECLGNVYPFFC